MKIFYYSIPSLPLPSLNVICWVFSTLFWIFFMFLIIFFLVGWLFLTSFFLVNWIHTWKWRYYWKRSNIQFNRRLKDWTKNYGNYKKKNKALHFFFYGNEHLHIKQKNNSHRAPWLLWVPGIQKKVITKSKN